MHLKFHSTAKSDQFDLTHEKIAILFDPVVIKLLVETWMLCEQNLRISHKLNDNVREQLDSLTGNQNELRMNIVIREPTILFPSQEMMVLNCGTIKLNTLEESSGGYDAYKFLIDKQSFGLVQIWTIEEWAKGTNPPLGDLESDPLAAQGEPMVNAAEKMTPGLQGTVGQFEIIKEFSFEMQMQFLKDRSQTDLEDWLMWSNIKSIDINANQNTLVSLRDFFDTSYADIQMYRSSCGSIMDESTNHVELFLDEGLGTWTKVNTMQCNDKIIILKPNTFIPTFSFDQTAAGTTLNLLADQSKTADFKSKVQISIGEKTCQLSSTNEPEMRQWFNVMKMEQATQCAHLQNTSVGNIDLDKLVEIQPEQFSHLDTLLLQSETKLAQKNPNGQTGAKNEDAIQKKSSFNMRMNFEGLTVKFENVKNLEGAMVLRMEKSVFDIKGNFRTTKIILPPLKKINF